MKNKLLMFIPFAFALMMVLTGCQKSIDGKYAVYDSDLKGLSTLSIEDDKAVMELSVWENDGFSVEKSVSKLEGDVNKSKKTINFNTKNGTLSYEIEDDGLKISDGESSDLKYYESSSNKYDSQIQEFSDLKSALEEENDAKADDENQDEDDLFGDENNTSSAPVSKKQEKLIKKFKKVRAEKSKELYKDLYAKVAGTWKWIENVDREYGKSKDTYTFYEDEKIDWIRDWGLGKSDIDRGSAKIEFAFPTDIFEPIDSNTLNKTDQDNEDIQLTKLSSRQLNKMIDDIKEVSFESYLEKFGKDDSDDEAAYSLRVYDNTGDNFKTLIKISFPQSNDSIVKISTTDWTSASYIMEDFTKQS